MSKLGILLIAVLAAAGLGSCGTTATPAAPDETPPVVPGTVTAQVPGTPDLPLVSSVLDQSSPTAPSAAAEVMTGLAKRELAGLLGIPIEQVAVVEVQQVLWRDASLGCPRPAIDFIRVETPGFRILLEAGGITYDYHTDETSRVVLCSPL